MPRLNVIDPANATGRAKELFDGPLKSMRVNIFKGMANSPAVLDMYLAMAGALAKAGLTAREQEAIHLAMAERRRCGYCAAAHTMIGKGAGLTDAQLLEARRGVLADARLNALVRFAIAIDDKKGQVSDADVQQMRGAGYTDAHIAEAVAVVAMATFTNYFNHVNDTTLDFPAAPAL